MVCAHHKGAWMKEVFFTSAIPGSQGLVSCSSRFTWERGLFSH